MIQMTLRDSGTVAGYPSPPTPLPQGARGEECQRWHHLHNKAWRASLLPSPLAGEGLGVRGSGCRCGIIAHVDLARLVARATKPPNWSPCISLMNEQTCEFP